MQSKATTVAQYLAELPPDRREALTTLRSVILKNLDKGYEERMGYGMPGYCVPHSIFPAGYHCNPKDPLPFAGFASQKQHISLYIMFLYCGCDGSEDNELVKWFKDAWAKSGKKKLDMGRCCIRFKKLDDIPLDVIGEAIRRMPLKKYVAGYEAALADMAKAKATRTQSKLAKSTKKKAAAKKVAPKLKKAPAR